jgi:hypothetical protein
LTRTRCCSEFQELPNVGRVADHQPSNKGKQNMRVYLSIVAIAMIISTPALAQATRDSNTPPAVATPSTPPPPGAPVRGANSFTEGQAKSRIESMGYANVSELKQDNEGIWRGKAMKDGRSVVVSLDFQGNVSAR